MTKVIPSNVNETKSDIFPWDKFKSDIIFIGLKILKYFNDFYAWDLLLSLQDCAKTIKEKLKYFPLFNFVQ